MSPTLRPIIGNAKEKCCHKSCFDIPDRWISIQAGEWVKRRLWRQEGLISCRLAWGITQWWLLRNTTDRDILPGWSPDALDIEIFCTGDLDRFIRRRKAGKRAQKSLQEALAIGRLRAWYFDGLARQSIPTWAWLSDDRVKYAWQENRLPLDVFLPDEWGKWSAQTCFIPRSEFAEWLAVDLPRGVIPPLTIAEASEKPPAPVKHRLPAAQPYVDLSQALSWIAFDIALGPDDLLEVMQSGRIGTGIEWAEAQLARAVEDFADAALAGKIQCVGKYCASVLARDGLVTDEIKPLTFMDYRRFDPVYNGMLYGRGLNHLMRNDILNILGGDGRKDLFIDIHVSRDHLLAAFSHQQQKTANPPVQKTVMKRLPDAKLGDWLSSLGVTAERMSQRTLHNAATLAFPDNRITRDQIRAITNGRKSGPKPVRR